MQTVEFEANIINGIIEVPPKYRDLHDKYAKVTLCVEDDKISEDEVIPSCEIEISNDKSLDLNPNAKAQALDLSQISISCFDDVNPVEYQRKIRDAR